MSKLNELKAYKIVKEENIPEVNGKGYILEHIKTKARVLIIENDDTNRVFNIGFRTPPCDDSGIPHILEHSVLCGSKKYPVKDPFIELAKGSLNTFLNAMTYSDKTVYPVASYNIQDFENLMKVYLDAVFYPNIYIHSEIMRQEGWHYELESLEDDLKYNGVVYNEMKGVYSSAEQQLYRIIEGSLFPDTIYSFESGGDPKHIPELTQEKFEEFHKKYYHPSNSYIYLYGDLDMVKELEFIDEEYLSKYDYLKVDSEITKQEAYADVRKIQEFYNISDDEDLEDNTYLAYSKVIGDSTEKKQVIAMGILEYALMDAPGAPLKTALIDAGICDDVFSSFDSGVSQTSFSVIAKNSNADDLEKFVSIIEDTLRKTAENLDKRSVEAAINNFEFKHKEANFGRYPKGLMLGLDAFNTWLYDDASALELFKRDHIYKELKEDLKGDYFEKLILEKLLLNKFGITVIFAPKKGLDAACEAEEKKKLEAYKNSLSEAELLKIIEDTKLLKKYQEEPSSAEDMAKVPLLNVSDIDKENRRLNNNICECAGLKLIHHDIFTNGIGYLEFLFDISGIKAELLPAATLLTAVFKYVDTENYTYGELSNEINFNTGGIAISNGGIKTLSEKLIPYLSIKTKAMEDKLPKAVKLIEEILFKTKLDDVKRLREIIAEEKTGMKSDLSSSGHITAANRAMSYIDDSCALKDLSEGIGYYEYLIDAEKIIEENPELIINQFKDIVKYAINKNRLTLSFTGNIDAVKNTEKEIKAFAELMSNEPKVDEETKISLSVRNEGFKTSSQVQYVATAGDFVKAGYEYDGALNVLQIIFSYGYLWENVRVKGGAYGAMCTFSRSGLSYLTSYRDPNLMQTYDIYKNAYKYVENFECSDRDMTKNIIGAIAKMDSPMTPSAEGSYNFVCYLSEITDEVLQKKRDDILGTNCEKIRKLAPIVKAVTDSNIICAIGAPNKLEEAKENFKELRSIF